MRFVISRAALALCLALAPLACGAGAGQSRVERGEAMSTGAPAYDTFFREVAEARAEAEKAGADASAAAKPLAGAIGAGNATSPTEVVRAEAKKLQMDGTLLHLDLLPEAKLVTSAKPEASSEKLLAAAEESARASLAVARAAAGLVVRIADLERRRVELVEKAPASFTDSGKRDEVTRELGAAASVLESARKTAEAHAGSASRLTLDLAMALETGAGSGAVAKKPPAKPGGKPGGTGTAAPAKPKGDDFDR